MAYTDGMTTTTMVLLLALLGCEPVPTCAAPHAGPECPVCCYARCDVMGRYVVAECDGLGNAWCGGEVECDGSECWPLEPTCECSDACMEAPP